MESLLACCKTCCAADYHVNASHTNKSKSSQPGHIHAHIQSAGKQPCSICMRRRWLMKQAANQRRANTHLFIWKTDRRPEFPRQGTEEPGGRSGGVKIGADKRKEVSSGGKREREREVWSGEGRRRGRAREAYRETIPVCTASIVVRELMSRLVRSSVFDLSSLRSLSNDGGGSSFACARHNYSTLVRIV